MRSPVIEMTTCLPTPDVNTSLTIRCDVPAVTPGWIGNARGSTSGRPARRSGRYRWT